MEFVQLGLGITNKTMGMELGFKPKIGQEMGFRQNFGWEMGFKSKLIARLSRQWLLSMEEGGFGLASFSPKLRNLFLSCPKLGSV